MSDWLRRISSVWWWSHIEQDYFFFSFNWCEFDVNWFESPIEVLNEHKISSALAIVRDRVSFETKLRVFFLSFIHSHIIKIQFDVRCIQQKKIHKWSLAYSAWNKTKERKKGKEKELLMKIDNGNSSIVCYWTWFQIIYRHN